MDLTRIDGRQQIGDMILGEEEEETIQKGTESVEHLREIPVDQRK